MVPMIINKHVVSVSLLYNIMIEYIFLNLNLYFLLSPHIDNSDKYQNIIYQRDVWHGGKDIMKKVISVCLCYIVYLLYSCQDRSQLVLSLCKIKLSGISQNKISDRTGFF